MFLVISFRQYDLIWKKEKIDGVILPIVIYIYAVFGFYLIILILFALVIWGGAKSGQWSLNKDEINEYKTKLKQRD